MSPVFARIYKVDEQTRTVFGRAAQEVVDRDNEIFDYKSSKPEFQKWSAEVFHDTDGQSLGNVRSMHGNTCAGKLTDIVFDDIELAIDITAKIVDDNEWKKVTEGCYSGFSIGGRYSKKWAEPINGKMVTRYTAVPSEISIVDRPCVPTAKFFMVHKADGSSAQVAFKYSDDQARDDHGRWSGDGEVSAGTNAAGGHGDDWSETTAADRERATAQEAEASYERQQDHILNDEEAIQDDEGTDGPQSWVNPASVSPAAAADPYHGERDRSKAQKRKFSDKQRTAAAESGAAMPDGSFPIKTVQDLKNAVQAHGRAKNPDEAKAHIISRAKALGATSALPDDWHKADGTADAKVDQSDDDDDDDTEKVAPRRSGTTGGARRPAPVALPKRTPTPARRKSDEGDLAKSDEDTVETEMSPGLYSNDVSEFAKALRGALGALDGDLEKRGARNSAKDLETIQKVHDASCELGACCTNSTQEKAVMADDLNKGEAASAIATEGNKRGAAVTDPSLPAESANGVNDDTTASGTGATKSKSRAQKDMEMSAKRKSRASDDDDDFDDDDDDDMDDDDDDRGEKSRKARKAKKASKAFSAEDLAKAVADGVAQAMAAMAKADKGDTEVMIPRVPPNLMALGKNGEVSKVDLDSLRKSVSPVNGARNDAEDRDTATLIKAIHADPRFRINPSEIPS